MTSHLIFDFFGTLVAYSRSRTAQGFPETYACYRSLGGVLDYSAFAECWSAGFEELDESTARSLREYSMAEAAEAFQTHASFAASPEVLAKLASLYLQEWNEGVRYIEGVASMLGRLARGFDLSIITNTHDLDLVPAHLQRLGISHLFSQVVTSISFGVRKPCSSIFEFALERLSVRASECVYIGDSHVPDFEGPRSVGIRPLLIDAAGTAPVEPRDRIRSILELEAVVATGLEPLPR